MKIRSVFPRGISFVFFDLVFRFMERLYDSLARLHSKVFVAKTTITINKQKQAKKLSYFQNEQVHCWVTLLNAKVYLV